MNNYNYLQNLGYVSFFNDINKNKIDDNNLIITDNINSNTDINSSRENEKKSEDIETIIEEKENEDLRKHEISAELKKALEVIKNSVTNENDDELFYDSLIADAPDDYQKEIIESIRDDERKHEQMLRKLYFEISGETLPANSQKVSTPSETMSYTDGLRKALLNEFSGINKYKNLLKYMTNINWHNTILEIIIDEQKHASMYNYLITLNRI